VTFKVGVINPTTGSFAFFGKEVNTGMRLYFNSIGNRVGGVQIQLVEADTAGDPQQALDQARRLVQQEKVDMLTGVVNSAIVLPVAQFADQAKIPFLVTVGGVVEATGPNRSPWLFRTGFANGQQDRPLGWYAAAKLGIKRAATLAWDFIAGAQHVDAFAETFRAAGGEIVSQQKPPMGTTDFGPYISQIDPNSVQAIFAFVSGPAAISFAQQLRQFGFTPKLTLLAPDFFTAGVLGQMGDAAEGMVQAGGYTPELDNPENRKFVDAYSKETGGEPGVYAEEGWLGAQVIAAAIKEVGTQISDREKLRQAFQNVRLSDTPGGALRFDSRGQAIRDTYITRVVKGSKGLGHQILEVIKDVGQDWQPPR
jgi:branched-chain amino acid transport system substrate-binding protein